VTLACSERAGRRRNRADYHVPANADTEEIDAGRDRYSQPQLDSPGARGIGEIWTTGTGPALANAILHATEEQIRGLPIAPSPAPVALGILWS
jgi:xanthine dehydrogenase YagR molybdenum-binding subunit